MHIAVLTSPRSWYLGDLRRAAGRRHVVHSYRFDDLTGHVPGRKLEPPALSDPPALSEPPTVSDPPADVILVRSMPPGSLEQVVFRMNVLGQWADSGRVVLNPPLSLECAIDKYLSVLRIQRAGLPVPETIACQSAEAAHIAFERLGGDVVVKPLFGGEGRGITRISDPALAERAFRLLEQLDCVIYLQPFLPHAGHDLRLFVVGDMVWGIRRCNALDWRTNLSRGARAEPLDVTPELARLARRAAAAVGAPIAGVDVLPANDGRQYVLEVNAVPGWKGLSQTLGLDVAKHVIGLAEQLVRKRPEAASDTDVAAQTEATTRERAADSRRS